MKPVKTTLLIRLTFIVLFLLPLLFFQPFLKHFYTHLTGTVINRVVKEQWHLVLFFVFIFSVFIIPLTYRKRTKWIDYGLVGAFFVSLFVEMYGIPLTVLLASNYFFNPNIRVPKSIIKIKVLGVGLGMDHVMVYASVLMIVGILFIVTGWWTLYRQAKRTGFAKRGLYRYSRHPQYVGFLLLILGWFYGWPTILTVIFSPILIYKYIRAARAEEKDMLGLFGAPYQEYVRGTPFLI